MTLVATIVLVEIDEPDCLRAGFLTIERAIAMREAIDAVMPPDSLIIAIMNPDEASDMLDAHLKAVKTTRVQVPTGPLH